VDRRHRHLTASLASAVIMLGACAGEASTPETPAITPDPPPSPTASSGSVASKLPSPGTPWDYQLGGAYEPAPDVAVVVRDREATPAAGRFGICYINGFQTQPGDAAWWLAEHPDLVLIDGDGTPVIDPDWPDEMILDISTSTQRNALAVIVGEWIEGCATSGFDAVEFDNLDTFSRFPEALAADDAVAFATDLVARAHAAGLAAGQKNAADLVERRDETGFDFAIVEQCAEYDECGVFIDAFAGHVLDVEYDTDAFDDACVRWPELAPILRDLDLTVPGSSDYVRRTCPD
jgi:hypothetical protein